MGEADHTRLPIKFKSKIVLLFLIIIVPSVAILNYFWLKEQDQILVGIDSWDFYPQTTHVYRHLTGQEEVGFDPGISHGSYRGPLFHWASLPLPLAGLISADPIETVARAYADCDRLAKILGSKLTAPFMTLSFLALPALPRLRLTDLGLFDGEAFRHTSLFV